jgi:flagellar basal-body rod modification protein FlgD
MPDAVSSLTSSPVVSSVTDLMTTQKQVTSPNPNGELGKDAFLKLLVAQLKYQDPSSPVDSSQFMAQTAAFTQVEKLDAMAKDSAANLALQQGLAASALVGRTVSYVDENGITQRGVVTSASFGGSGSAEPAVHIGDTAVPLSSIVSVDDGGAPAPDPAPGGTSAAVEVTAEQEAAATAEQKAAEQKAMTDAISAALTQAFASGVTGSIADAVAQAVAAAMAASSTTDPASETTTHTSTATSSTTSTTTSTTGTDATTDQGTGTDATAAPTTGTSPAPAGPTS